MLAGMDSTRPPHRFGEFELRPEQRLLLARGEPVKLGARAFDILLALLERRERLVGKDELLALVWPRTVVEENNLQVHVSALRKLLGPQVITTVPGHGYRFTARLLDEPAAAPPAAAAAPLPSRPGFADDSQPLLGRQTELQAAAALLHEHRLVTLVGAGGVGKTRLARALAAAESARYADGVAWADLSPLREAAQLLPALAQATATALPENASPRQLAQALAGRVLLLVLDNCEHLAAPAADAAQALLAAAPGLRLLVTSQLPLQLEAEQLLRLGELPLPAADADAASLRSNPAVALFERRARAADAAFVLDDAGLPGVAALCRELDGNPLAIEMAAARAPQIGLQTLALRLGERLRMLRSAERHRPARQQSLRATLEWSHALLAPADQRVLQQLAVCAGSFGLPLAQALACDGSGPGFDEWDALDALARLVERSLVRIERLDPPRYRLLESPRLFALESLQQAGGEAAARQRHGQALAAIALGARADVFVLTQQQFIDRYADDSADLQAAHSHAVQAGNADVAAATGELLSALEAARSGLSLRRARMHAAMALLPLAQQPLTRALLANQVAPASSISWPGLPRRSAAEQRLAAWQAVGDLRECYLALIDLAAEAARAGDAAQAEARAEQALALEDPSWPPALRLAGALLPADLALYRSDSAALAAAEAGLQRALALAEAIGDERRILRVRFRIAEAATAAGRWPEAIAEGQAVVAELQRQNRPLQLGMALANLAAAHGLSGDTAAARAAASAALPLLLPHHYGGVLCHHLALLSAQAGRAGEAALLLGHADAWYAANQSPQRQAVEQRLLAEAWPVIEAQLGAQAGLQREAGARAGAAEAQAWMRRALD